MSDKIREAFESWYRSRTDGFMPSFVDGEYDWADAQPCWEAWQAALAQQPAPVAVPDGFRLVPVETTIEMEDAGRKAASGFMRLGEAGRVFRAMLAAAPSAPAAPAPVAQVFGTVCGGDAEHNTVNVHVGGSVPAELWTIGAQVSLCAYPAAEQPDAVKVSRADAEIIASFFETGGSIRLVDAGYRVASKLRALLGKDGEA